MFRTLRLVVAAVLLTPAWASAQAEIAGIVRDPSGAVLPGVSVEAASPALIEKVRTVVTDDAGQYRIVDLRPGIYSVTFSLPGFSVIKREGLELAGSFTATVNAELRLGALEETVTVTGEAPVVDTQNTTSQRALTKAVLDAIPAGRSHLTQAILIPGLTSSQGSARGNLVDVGGTQNLQNTLVSIHGGRQEDTRVMIDGVRIGNMSGAGQWHNFVPDQGATQEVVVDYGALSAENISGGLKINYVPREGGNTFRGSFFGTVVTDAWQQDNVTDELRAQGLTEPNRLRRMYDVNPNVGGPIVVDKLWFYASARWQENKRFIAGFYENANAGDPTKWLYEPDTSQQVLFSLNQKNGNGRLTWQAAEKHKVSFFYDQQSRIWDDNRPLAASESSSWWRFPRLRTTQVGWTSPVTNRLLLEARWSNRGENFIDAFQDTTPRRDLIAVQEQGGLIPGLVYRGHSGGAGPAPFNWNSMPNLNTVLFNASYVTGSHAFKFGVSDTWGSQRNERVDIPEAVAYRFNNGVPNLIQMRATPYESTTTMRGEFGLYAQDRWTIDKLTLTAGLRFDYLSYYFPEVAVGPGPLVPNRNFTIPQTESVNWKDITPRVGLAYDLFGDGRTALKFSAGEYVINQQAESNQAPANPVTSLSVVSNRAWNDIDRDYVPDCNLLNLQPNGECGIADDLNFGGQRPSRRDDPETYNGWGTRPYNWEVSTGVQHQLMTGLGIEVGYFRRIYGNFVVQDNEANTAADYTEFSIVAPLDPRLPDGGGYTVGGLYDLNPNKVGQVDNLVTFASKYGRWIEHWNGIDVTVNARLANGLVLQGGTSTGRTSTDVCEVRAKLPEMTFTPSWSQFPFISPTTPYCKVDANFQTQVKMLGTYTVPRAGIVLAATFQSVPGPMIGGTYVATNADVIPSLGRPLSGGVANVQVNVVEAGKYFVEYSNLLDVRIGKILPFAGSRRLMLNLDIHNMLNNSSVLLANNNLASWLTPQSIMEGRLFKISANLDF
jgi:hypothetical protein